jgi:hypothetical protein
MSTLTALMTALQTTARRLESGASYQWGHFGQCNCGHLAQTLLRVDHVKLHEVALQGDGDWEMIANQYCPTSGRHIDDVVTDLLDLGLTTQDLAHLEKLTDPRVLAALPGGKRWLRRNDRADVIAYMLAWAQLVQSDAAVATNVEPMQDRLPDRLNVMAEMDLAA